MRDRRYYLVMVKVIRITKKEGKFPGMKEREREAMSYLEAVVDMRPPHEKSNKLDSSN